MGEEVDGGVAEEVDGDAAEVKGVESREGGEEGGLDGAGELEGGGGGLGEGEGGEGGEFGEAVEEHREFRGAAEEVGEGEGEEGGEGGEEVEQVGEPAAVGDVAEAEGDGVEGCEGGEEGAWVEEAGGGELECEVATGGNLGSDGFCLQVGGAVAEEGLEGDLGEDGNAQAGREALDGV